MKVINMQKDVKSIEITQIQGFLNGSLDIFDLIVGPNPAQKKQKDAPIE